MFNDLPNNQTGYVQMIIDFDDDEDDQTSPDRTPPKKSPKKSIPERAMVGLRPSSQATSGQAQDEAPDVLQTPPESPTSAFSKLSLNSSTKNKRRSNPSRFSTDRPEVFQSITCVPSQRQTSFEELRIECYRISLVSKGRLPIYVDQDTPWPEIIRPYWRPFVDDGDSAEDVARRARAASMDVPMPDWPYMLSLDDGKSEQCQPGSSSMAHEVQP